MLLRSNLLSYLLCRADAVSDERSESITKDSGRFPRRTCGSPRNDDFIFPLPSRRSDGKRSAAITSFPQRVFKDLRVFKENRVGTAGGSAVSDERSAAITDFPKKVFKDLRDFKDFKEDMSPMRRTRPPHRRQRHPACALCRNYRDALCLCRCVNGAVIDSAHLVLIDVGDAVEFVEAGRGIERRSRLLVERSHR